MNVESLAGIKRNPKIPDLTPGDTVRVYNRVVEAGKERLQPFQGVIIRVKRGGVSASFTVRRIAYGVGVERTFPLYSPRVDRVEVLRHGKVRRAKLYYLRGRSGKAARLKEHRIEKDKGLSLSQVAAEELVEEALEAAPAAEAVQEQAEETSAALAPEEAEEENPPAETEPAAVAAGPEETAGQSPEEDKS